MFLISSRVGTSPVIVTSLTSKLSINTPFFILAKDSKGYFLATYYPFMVQSLRTTESRFSKVKVIDGEGGFAGSVFPN